jgi:hypothetical protein
MAGNTCRDRCHWGIGAAAFCPQLSVLLLVLKLEKFYY